MADVSLMELEEELEEEHLLGLVVLGESHVIQPLEASLESPYLFYLVALICQNVYFSHLSNHVKDVGGIMTPLLW